jgi:hypothetical protein
MAKTTGAVPEQVRKALYDAHAGDPLWDREVANRLFADRSIWIGVAKLEKGGPGIAKDFYSYACQLGKAWDKIPRYPAAKAAAELEQIAKTASRLADQIAHGRAAIILAGGSFDLANLASIAYRNRRESHGLSDAERQVLEDLAMLVHGFGPGRLPSFRELLDALGGAINPGNLELLPHRPKKLGDATARRTFICQNLFIFLKDRGVEIPDALLATIVNTIVDYPNSTLDGSHVTKLLKRLRQH